jgi:tetratricopeptide (TPR) repeat protein
VIRRGASAPAGIRGGAAALLGFSLVQLACAGAPPQTLDDLSTDLRVDSLPARAQVAVNGQWLGFTPATIHLDRGQTYQVAVSAPGFQMRAFGGTADALLRVRSFEVVLVPDGLTSPAPQGNDAAGLTAIAERLEALKDWNHAAEFWRRVVTLAPRGARGHRGLGSAYAKLGQDELAIREYAQYLFLAPNAPDAARVQRAIDAYRGGINVPTVGDENP